MHRRIMISARSESRSWIAARTRYHQTDGTYSLGDDTPAGVPVTPLSPGPDSSDGATLTTKAEMDTPLMKLHLYPTKSALGEAAAAAGAKAIRDAIATKGQAHIIVATGASQFEMLDALVRQPGIDWSKVTGFHLDEYIGMPDSHPASFRRYLRERFTSKLPTIGAFRYVEGDAPDLAAEITRIGDLIKANPIDVTFAGIGENGHLAFNDPPADFDVEDPYIVVQLDEVCRRQQFGEGWFPTFEDVPQTAISMSVRQIMKSRLIILSVPDARKADAVRKALEGPVSPACPASILQKHPDCHVFLDPASASKLSPASLAGAGRDAE
jgi:glucosamine-6-phosphate deaminase